MKNTEVDNMSFDEWRMDKSITLLQHYIDKLSNTVSNNVVTLTQIIDGLQSINDGLKTIRVIDYIHEDDNSMVSFTETVDPIAQTGTGESINLVKSN